MILELSGFLGLCLLIAKMADLGSIWSHLGNHFRSHFGAKSAQEELRWAQEKNQEPQGSKNVQLQKPYKTIGFSRFLGLQDLPKQLLKAQEGSQEAILSYSGTS